MRPGGAESESAREAPPEGLQLDCPHRLVQALHVGAKPVYHFGNAGSSGHVQAVHARLRLERVEHGAQLVEDAVLALQRGVVALEDHAEGAAVRVHDAHLGAVRALEQAAQQADGAAVDDVAIAVDRQHQRAARGQVVQGNDHLHAAKEGSGDGV